MTSLVLYEIANDTVHILPQDFMICEDTVDRLSDAAQTLSPFLVLKCEVKHHHEALRYRLAKWRGRRETVQGGLPEVLMP
jgi:hypothetical protein